MPNPLVSSNLLSYLRWGALSTGLVYGLYRNNVLYREWKPVHDEHELEAKLQKEANEIWDEHKAKEMGVIFNADDPNFDLEKVIEYASSS